MTLSEFIIVTSKESKHGYSELKPKIICNDGFEISVQAGIGLYSSPRKYAKEYTSFELGFPSNEENLIKKYAESDDYNNTVYPYTPAEIVQQVIEKHGGINVLKTFN